MAAKYIVQHNIIPREMGIVLVVNSGEEGLGNLKGSRKILETYKGRVTEFITFDGTAGHIFNRAVGSRRYRVKVTTEGGHSYNKFGNTNAIAVLASIIDRLYEVKVPSLGKTTYNVGIIQGGTSVNTIAQYAEMLYEYRSDSWEAMEIMESNFQQVLDYYRSQGHHISVIKVGDRPCSGQIDQAKEQILMDRAASAIKLHYGFDPDFRSGSTDCNIPLSQGVPAVCVGCVEGEGAHTREEYVDIPSLLPGLKVAFSLILHHF
jgi:acetylornithine deacetylase/succinyl-diaminopimelate desuccinylase-like protein